MTNHAPSSSSASQDGPNRRQYPRYYMALDVAFGPAAATEIKAATTELQRTVTVNISRRGVCVYSETLPSINSTLYCAVTIPGRAKPVQAVGPLVWFQKADQQAHGYKLGIEFSDISAADDAALQGLFDHPPAAEASRAKKLLLIDDDQELQLALKLRFEASGFQVVTASEGLDGLRKSRDERPDLIILDLMLPKLNGYDVCRLLKFDQKFQRIPIVLCTARSRAEDMEQGHAVGANAYITKPFDGKALMAKIEELLAARS